MKPSAYQNFGLCVTHWRRAPSHHPRPLEQYKTTLYYRRKGILYAMDTPGTYRRVSPASEASKNSLDNKLLDL